MALHHEVPVLVVGLGPAGLIASLQLAANGVPCMVAERSLETTKWPKMDITNCRSMEIFKRLKIAEGLREVGVASDKSFNVLFSTGLSEGGRLLGKWDLPSVDEWRLKIDHVNDGSMPREPYQRCSQAIFESWLKPRMEAEPLIKSLSGLKFESMTEGVDFVTSCLIDHYGVRHIVKSQYVIACDGAGSSVRREFGINLIGGPVPGAMYLVHFKSRDLERLHIQGQFWHIFFTTGHVIISQDEKDTWTIHTPIPLDANIDDLNPRDIICEALGAEGLPCHIKIDEILITSRWRPNICIAERYISPGGRVFLSGDAAHQNIPTGGYGMNTAVGDSFDIGWKVAAVVKGYGGRVLLQSYEEERRPVAVRNIERSGVHFEVHRTYGRWCTESKGLVSSDSEDGEAFRKQISEYIQNHDNENKDHGLELGYRYTNSPVIAYPDDSSAAPEWKAKAYVPSTWPGARAPHVFLTAQSNTSIFDLFGEGPEFTVVDFTDEGLHLRRFEPALIAANIPHRLVHLPNERHAREVWERDVVIVRPDDHIAWRCSSNQSETCDPEAVLTIITGKQASSKRENTNIKSESLFTRTIGHVDQEKVEMLGKFQT